MLDRYIDFMNVLSYDYHTAYDPETDHHAPLFKRADVSRFSESARFNMEWTVDYYLSLGAPPHKIIPGVPTYGRSFTLLDANKNGLGAPAEGPGDAGPATREKGYLAYYEICQKIDEEQWNIVNDHSETQGPYAYKVNPRHPMRTLIFKYRI